MRCSATNRRGENCGRWARVGGLVCSNHGAKSPQALIKGDARLTLAQLLRDGRDPRLALLDAVNAADALFRQDRDRVLGGELLTADELERWMTATARLAQLAKTAVDGKYVDVRTQQVEQTVARVLPLLVGAVSNAVDSLALPAPDRDRLSGEILSAMRENFARAEKGLGPVPRAAVPAAVEVSVTAVGDPALETAQTVSGPSDAEVDAEAASLRATVTRLRPRR